MADSETPNYRFTLCTVGLDRDVWGDLENDNWSRLDTDLKAVSDSSGGMTAQLAALINNIKAYVEPVGSIKPWPAPTPPPGWAPCDGGEVSRTDWAGLFAVIGGTWGVGNGSTTFNLPNFIGRTLVHRDNAGIFVGSQFGEGSHTLNIAEMPGHAHPGSATDAQGNHVHTYHRSSMTTPASQLQPGSGFALSESDTATDAAGLHAHNVAVAAQGGGAAHNNLQPSSGVLWIIKAFHAF